MAGSSFFYGADVLDKSKPLYIFFYKGKNSLGNEVALAQSTSNI